MEQIPGDQEIHRLKHARRTHVIFAIDDDGRHAIDLVALRQLIAAPQLGLGVKRLIGFAELVLIDALRGEERRQFIQVHAGIPVDGLEQQWMDFIQHPSASAA